MIYNQECLVQGESNTELFNVENSAAIDKKKEFHQKDSGFGDVKAQDDDDDEGQHEVKQQEVDGLQAASVIGAQGKKAKLQMLKMQEAGMVMKIAEQKRLG